MPENNFKSRAAQVLSRGFRVIPIEPRGKKPLIAEWPSKATAGQGAIDSWAEQFPDANVGLVAGDTVTLDFDSPRFLMEFFPEFPKTFVVKTGGGGYQVHFLATEESRVRLSNLAVRNEDQERWGKSETLIEVKAANAYGIGPGSVHPNGNTYQVFKDLPLAPIPTGLIDKVLGVQQRPLVEAGLTHPAFGNWEQRLLAAGLKCSRAERGGKVYLDLHVSMGRCLVKGSQHLGSGNPTNNRCSSFVFNPANGELWYQCLAGGCASDLKTALAALGLKPKDILYFGMPRSEARKAFESFSEMPNEPSKLLVSGFLSWGISALAALPGEYKTFMALSLCKALARSKRLWETWSIPRACPTLYLLPEASRGHLKNRMEVLRMKDLGDDFLSRTYSKGPKLGLDSPEVRAMAEGRLVVLDTLVRFAEGEENSASDNKKLAENMIDLMGEYGAVGNLMLHHSAKNFRTAEVMNNENALRGTGDFAAICDAIYAMKILGPLDGGVVHVENTKPRDFEPVRPFQLLARPSIDKEGDFSMLKKPGECGWLWEELALLKGSKPSANRGDTPDRQAQAFEMFDQGLSQNKVGETLHARDPLVKEWKARWEESKQMKLEGEKEETPF